LLAGTKSQAGCLSPQTGKGSPDRLYSRRRAPGSKADKEAESEEPLRDFIAPIGP